MTIFSDDLIYFTESDADTPVMVIQGNAGNVGIADEMRERAAAWQTARDLACSTEVDWRTMEDSALVRSIDPDDLVKMHRRKNPAEYWRLYIEHQATAIDCTGIR